MTDTVATRIIKNLENEGHVCTICFCTEGFSLKCVDNSCTTHVCEDCFVVYLNHCLNENSLVKCLNQFCKFYILSDSFNSTDYYPLYKKVIINAFMYSQGSEVTDKIIMTKMITDLRSERKRFIKEFPLAIKLIINVALQKKLNSIDKHNKLFMKDLVTSANRLCMISHCNGKLAANFECLKCSTKFCKLCEKILKENHICSENDVESLKLISQIIKCPNCLIPIEKSQGCNNMTCASCKTNFLYKTGQISAHGSRNVIINPQKTKFKFDFKQKYPIRITNLLYKVEYLEPPEPSTVILNNVIEKLIFSTENNLPINDDEVLKSFEKYIKNKINYIKFMSIIADIQEHHEKDNIDENYLETMLKSYA